MDIEKYHLFKKFDAIEDVELNTNLLIMQQITFKWFKSKSDNEDLKNLKDAVLKVTEIANKLKYEKHLYYKALSEYNLDKIRAVNRARKSEQELLKYREKEAKKIKNL